MNKMKLKEFKMDKEDHKIYRTEECCDNKLRINQILCDSEGEYTEQISVISTNAFEMIKEYVESDFNNQLGLKGTKRIYFKSNEIEFDSYFGKQLAVLFYGIYLSDITQWKTCVRRWSGFHPYERLWLYTMSSADNRKNENSHWKQAIQHILAYDN